MNPAVPGVPALATHAGARRLHAALGIALVVLAAVVAVLLLREVRVVWAAANSWTHHEVVVEGLADERWVEVELPAAAAAQMPALRQPAHGIALRDDHVRRLVPRPPYFGGWLRDERTLAQDPARPADPDAVVLLDGWAIAVPLLGKSALLALLAGAGLAWRLLPWGREQTWIGGRWVDTATTAHRAGVAVVAEGELREPREHFAGTRFWAIVCVLLTVLGLGFAITDWAASPVEGGAVLLLLVAFDLLMVHVYVSTRTRRWRFDAQGLADGSFFQTRRVPWGAVAAFEKVNRNAAAQRRYDDDGRSGRRRTSTSRRPRDLWMWELRAADGTVLTSLPHELRGTPAFEALRARLAVPLGLATPQPPAAAADFAAGSAARPLGAPAPGDEAEAQIEGGEESDVDDGDFDEHIDSAESPESAELEAARERFERSDRRFRRVATVGSVLMLLPFLLPTLWSTFHAARWAWASERIEARVVERGPGKAPPLTVGWRDEGGAERRVVTGGSDFYAHLVPGAPVTVLVRGPGPEDARMEHFLELWLLPLIGWILCAILAAPMWLIGRASRRHGSARH